MRYVLSLAAVPVVGDAGAHRQHRGGDRDQEDEAADRVAPRVATDVVGPTPRHRRVRGNLGLRAPAPDVEPVDLRARQPQEGGEQRDGTEHGDEDGDG